MKAEPGERTPEAPPGLRNGCIVTRAARSFPEFESVSVLLLVPSGMPLNTPAP